MLDPSFYPQSPILKLDYQILIERFFNLTAQNHLNLIISTLECIKQGSRACPGCGIEWPLSEYESAEIHENNTTSPDESQITSANPAPRHLRSTKTEECDSGPAQSQSQRKRRRPCKPEPADTLEPSRRLRPRARKA